MEPTGPERHRAAFLRSGVVIVLLAGGAVSARAAWQELSSVLALQGKPEPASANVLSEHHLAELEAMPPQAQAEFLLERSTNHYEGANREIEARLPKWRGKLEPGDRFENLFRIAINPDARGVRAAAIEVDIGARKLDKTSATIDRLEPTARSGEQ